MTKITNTTKAVLGVNAKVDGKVRSVSLAPGETKDVDVIETRVHKARVESGALKMGARAAKEAQNTSGLEAKHRGAGSYSIMRGDEEVAEGLSKADADAFNGMSDADRAAYVDKAKS